MLVVCHRYIVSAAVLFLWGTSANSITTAHASIQTVAPTCEARTINYITDTLPQLCFKSSWSNINATSTTPVQVADPTVTNGGDVENTPKPVSKAGGDVPTATQSESEEEASPSAQSSTSSIVPTASPATETPTEESENGELNDSSFLSFEEWKRQTLEKAGQADANIGKKRVTDGKKRDSASFQNHLDSIGEEGEIDIDIRFGGQRDTGLQAGETAIVREKIEKEERKSKDQHRSKDAGRTCKERFSYASFDAGATILKTHAGAKNSKSVLIENKDSYMRSECSVQNKFIIVELSEDIWIDTVVLANYESFSSMFRHFRVSLSDRYPVKIEKWKDAGTYEARNSRNIQAFLVENPQIWARYMRIEFLSHYGNEYYCPLSLVRVHGTRMLESWKESEANAEDEENEDNEGEGEEEEFVHEAVAESVQEDDRVTAELKDAHAQAEEQIQTQDTAADSEIHEAISDTSPWDRYDMFAHSNTTKSLAEDMSFPSGSPAPDTITDHVTTAESVSSHSSSREAISSAAPNGASNTGAAATSSPLTQKHTTTDIPLVKNSSSISSTSDKLTPRTEVPVSTGSSTKVQNGTSTVKTKTSSTSTASSSLPTIQESFFKAVSRRLNFLETNSTLSLKYIEEQSRVLREAFTRVEKKQMQKTAVFLETLNSTVLDELRGFRQQYDEIWQSTVISLESQREASRKEFIAISSRLNILADEVVFQKRMSIVQSVLLLLCLGLVIFSRVSGGGNNLDMSYLQGRVKNLYNYPLESPIESPIDSPSYHRTRVLREREGRWTSHKRQHSDDLPISRSRSRENSPPTPISTYSRDDVALTPPTGDLDGASDILPSDMLDLAAEEQLASKRSSYHSASSPLEEVELPSSSPLPVRAPKRHKPLVRQQLSPPPEELPPNWLLNSDLSPTPNESRERLSSQRLHPTLSRSSERRLVEGEVEEVESDEGSGEEEDEVAPIPTIHLPSPPPESRSLLDASNGRRTSSFSISRKPLPALPSRDGQGA